LLSARAALKPEIETWKKRDCSMLRGTKEEE